VTGYVLGFVFRSNDVLLICKTHPGWQAGRLNGVGGKIEEGETPEQAMHREFKEEVGGVRVGDWHSFAMLLGDNYVCYCYFAFCSSTAKVRALTEEAVSWYNVDAVPYSALPSTKWLIQMALDSDLSSPGVVADYRTQPL
jgi:8-oxo-dGTP diphosphatase